MQGTERYEVTLDWTEAPTRRLVARCNCPHYLGGDLCKHVWACIVVLDQEDVSATIAGNGPLSVAREGKLQPGESVAADDWKDSLTAPELWYVIDIPTSHKHAKLAIELKTPDLKPVRLHRTDIARFADPLDREILAMLFSGIRSASTFDVLPHLQRELIPRLARSGRLRVLHWDRGAERHLPVTVDDGEPWHLELRLAREGNAYVFSGQLCRSGQRRALHETSIVLRSGVVVFKDRIGWLDTGRHFGWLRKLGSGNRVSVPVEQGATLLDTLLDEPSCPPLDWPAELIWKSVRTEPRPRAVIVQPPAQSAVRSLRLRVDAEYGGQLVSLRTPGAYVTDRESRIAYARDPDVEQGLFARVAELGLEAAGRFSQDEYDFLVPAPQFAQVVRQLLAWGWSVHAEGKPVRQAKDFDVGVASGVDWFDLQGTATFEDGQTVSLPALLEALRSRERLIQLGDGGLGVLPEEWLNRFAPLADLGVSGPKGIRFAKSQGILLQLWLAREQSVTVDREFSQLRKRLGAFSELAEAEPSAGFRGKLRGYQKQGLTWLRLLQETSVGGILADDMGLGKTVQCLAHLEREYASIRRKGSPVAHRPSLVILPKSLLFNWREEAARFTPKLRVLCYQGSERADLVDKIQASDLVLVTYAATRIDFERLREIEFHYVIADEAQAIKNARSISAQACKLLRARHKLAMTGTPVENSIEDLYSILDFASPGLLGPGARTRVGHEPEALASLSRALKPFILRRTKDQVLDDLPPKTESVIHCELSMGEMKAYVRLRDHYRMSLKNEIAAKGMARSKIVVLEALLRLRQAACHPGLLDAESRDKTSAKLDALVEQLQLVVAEGHKALVFSQFTSFLDIVRRRLARENIAYEYLDGKTQNREERVARFQGAVGGPPVFLISLKAGGVGLNLTAADYVFLLDPWWNPAVETQAIDRTHRIGQKNKVMAYRLIAQGTVEEKILELQAGKRELAGALINGDRSLLSKMTFEDVEELLS